MSHFNFKSLTFYGIAIGLVLVLFEVVTAYGESNLKAPAPIDGRYRLSYQKPNPLKLNALVLTIQQSGIYLNGSLLPAQTNAQPTSAEEILSLTGQMRNQQLSLTGTVPRSIFYNNTVSQAAASNRPKDNSPSSIRLQSRVQGETLEGQITVSGIPEVIGFTAQKEIPAEPSKNSNSH